MLKAQLGMATLPIIATCAELHQAVARARLQLEADPECRWVAASVSTATGQAGRLLDLRLTEETLYFRAGAGSHTGESLPPPSTLAAHTLVGLGTAEYLKFFGEDRFRAAAVALPEALARLTATEEELDSLRFFGGGAFNAGDKRAQGYWEEFGDASFILPRVTYADCGTSARFILLVDRETLKEDVALAEQLLVAIAEPPHQPSAPLLREISRVEGTSALKWGEMVADIRAHIAHGDVQKVVAARRTTLHLSEEPRLSAVVQNLDEQAPLCTRFVLRLGEKTFLGATPERLIRKRGQKVSTEALAGSIDASRPQAREELLSSKKDRAEHEYVVRAIENVLRERCSVVSFSDTPEVRSLRRILHLRTPMTGELAKDVQILNLVDALHPTPAVGGVPQREAVNWILEHESSTRGWYASPFGWVDKYGNGEFVVALRSALIHGDQVHIYAGSGIVEGSDAQAEFEETALKLTGMVGALGLVG